MYGYAVSASAAATFTSFGQPPQTTNPAGQSSQGGAVAQAVDTSVGHSQTTLSHLMSAVTQRLQTLATGGFPSSSAAEASVTSTLTSTTPTTTPILTASTDLFELLGSTTLTFAVPKTVFQGGSFVTSFLQSGAQAPALPAMPGPAAGAAATAQTWAPADLPESVLASVGRAAPAGGLSVPQNWTAATAVAGPTTEPVASAETGFRALPPWVNATNTPAGMPVTGQITNTASRRGGNAVFRMRDRRYRMPRPALGG